MSQWSYFRFLIVVAIAQWNTKLSLLLTHSSFKCLFVIFQLWALFTDIISGNLELSLFLLFCRWSGCCCWSCCCDRTNGLFALEPHSRKQAQTIISWQISRWAIKRNVEQRKEEKQELLKVQGCEAFGVDKMLLISIENEKKVTAFNANIYGKYSLAEYDRETFKTYWG